MTTLLTLPPIETLAESAAALVEEAGEDRARVNALNKAMLQLHEGTVPVSTHGGFLLESRTRPGMVHRISNVTGCGCEAGRANKGCWHQSLIELIEHAAQRAIPMADRLSAARAVILERQRAAEAALDELYV